MRVLAVAAGKGGVAKTTTAVNLAALAAQLAWLTGVVGRRLARRRARYLYLEGEMYGTGGFDALLAGTLEERQVHLPFNPCLGQGSYLRHGQSIGGLRKIGQPDFWDPQWPAEVRSYPCEGYVLDRACREGTERVLRSRLADVITYVWSVFSSKQLKDNLAQYPELALLSQEEQERVVWDLRRELKPLFDLLDALYRDAISWYSPYWCYGPLTSH